MASADKKTKVICLGLGRTGTTSLQAALEKLGFGPVYHMTTIVGKGDPEEFAKWRKFTDGTGTPGDLQNMLDCYGAITDYPAAMFPEELYAAYPNAKFILSTRDPKKWEKSIKATLIPFWNDMRITPNKPPLMQALSDYTSEILEEWYHKGRLCTNAQDELTKHNNRVKMVIPRERLLVYQVEEGWDRLVEFLGVPKPREPFPHINKTIQFQERVKGFVNSLGVETHAGVDKWDMK